MTIFVLGTLRSTALMHQTLNKAALLTPRWMLLVDIIERLSLTRNLDDVGQVIRESARELTGADGITFVLREGEQCHYAAEDAISPLWLGQRFPLTACISGWCMLNGRTAVIPDIYADPRIPADAYRPTFVASLVMVPVGREAPFAAIGAYWARQRVPDDETVQLLEALARAAATSVVNARLTASLQESERRVRQLIEALPAAIYTTDPQGKVTYYNDVAAEFAGRRPVIGETDWCVTWKLFHPDGTPMPHETCPMAVALREARPVRGVEAIAERPDGSRVPFLPFPTPMFDEQGRLVGAVNMLIDISERKTAEASTRTLLDELNHRVKNNLQMLTSLLNMAQREAKSEETRSALSEASGRVAAMSAAQRAFYLAHASGSFKANEFVEAVCANARALSNAQIHCDAFDGNLPNDAAMPLALAINELLTNAIKYSRNGSGEPEVFVTLTRDDGGYRLEVRDKGPGFDPAIKRKRASGLGLVEGLARQLGGTFDVAAGPGARSTIRFPSQGAH